MNDYGIWLLLGGVVAVFFLLKRRGRIGLEEARRAWRNGAIVIDVRTPGEFAGGCLPGARNIPLDELGQRITGAVPDKETVLLCHCASGMRSGAAASQLRRMGYARAFNLGSFSRAASVIRP